MYLQFQELLSEILCLWISSRFFILVVIFWIVKKSFFSKRSTTFSIYNDHKYLLIIDSDILSKVESCRYKTEANIFLYFWVFSNFFKVEFTRECLEFPCCTIFHKAKFPSGCVNHVFYMLSYHITFWIWLNLVWYVTILQYVCPREL